MRRLSIVHTESSLGWGGQEIRILSESRGLIGRGHQATILCPAEARIFSEAPAWGVPAVALPIARKRPAGVGALRAWLRANRCDVLNTHSSTDSWLAALAVASLEWTLPIVRTRHISAPVPKNPFSRWLYEKAAAKIVTTGAALKQQLVAENGFPAERIESVPTGIDAGRFRPGKRGEARAKLGLSAQATLVGIVATLRSWKGHGFLLDAMRSLPATIELVVVGDGPMRPTLERQVEEWDLRQRVRMVGNQTDVVPWLQALDIFALPSYANEGVPQALIQAMLCAVPCVTTNVGSIAELARDGETALVVPARDAKALAGALERLATDRALAAELARAARRHCVENFSYDRMLDRMEAIYGEVCGARVEGERALR
ncbi:MAG TPA: glycosyltransferase [Burkholderiales bacterium]|nr:glycosyltransferase [Burkholderiales bacterium]